MIISASNYTQSTRMIDHEHLALELKQALRATMFSSTLRVAPRHLQQLADQLATLIAHALEHDLDTTILYNHGAQLVADGLSHRAILGMTLAINRFCWNHNDPDVQQAAVNGSLVQPILEGYMHAREAHLLREQELTRKALDRARLER